MAYTDLKKVGERIHNIRMSLSTKKKVSLQAFGKMISPPAGKSLVLAWEKGVNLPKKEKLEQIAKLGNVTVNYLLYGKELTGYGKNIEKIRLNHPLAPLNRNEFGKMFYPKISEEIIDSWENENALPTYHELKQLSKMSGLSFKEIILNIEPSYLNIRTINSDLEFDRIEDLIKEANLSDEEHKISEFIFSYTNELRKAQLTSYYSGEEIKSMLDNITWLMKLRDPLFYDYSNDNVEKAKPFNNLKEESEFRVQELIEQLEIMKQNLLDKDKEN